MSAQHTPGPWNMTADGCGFYVEGGDLLVASAQEVDPHPSDAEDYFPGDTTKANALLIAAAPELLEALKELSRSFIGTYSDDQRSDDEINNHREHWERMARAAIAKAEGGAA